MAGRTVEKKSKVTLAIDARKYFDYGIGTYIQNLIRGLSRLRSSFDFLAYISGKDRPVVSVPPSWKVSEVDFPKYSIQESFLFGKVARRDGVGIFHSPHYTLPYRLSIPSVVTIHDLIPLRFPEYFNVVQRTYARAMMSHAVSAASRILVDSEFVKLEVATAFKVDPKKIVVAHLGVGKEFRKVNSVNAVREFRERYSLAKPYILFVGNTKPHKGLQHLLRAFGALRRRGIELVLVGGGLDRGSPLAALVDEIELRGTVRELKRISTQDLVMAYNGAEVLVLPSLYEGFGLPAIEAMACGTPVVASDGGALPEVVGDAAVIVRRGNVADLQEALAEVLGNKRLRKSLVAEGRKNIKRFSWQEMAKKTLGVYESVNRQ